MSLTYTDEERVRQIVREELEEKFKYVPTTDLFLTKMDEIAGMIKAHDENMASHTVIHEDIEDKLEEHGQQLIKINNKLNLSF